jgi:transcriptional antiterminator NusG
MDKKWYIIRAISGRENSVKKYLDEKIRFDPIFRMSFGKVLVPSESILSMSAKDIIRRMYPGYIFVQMDLEPRVIDAIRKMPGSLGIMCNPSGDPSPVPKKDMDRVFAHLGGEVVKKREIKFNIGEAVSIKGGPFNGFNGTISEVKSKRIVVSVSVFGRPTPVELDCDQVVVK